MKKLFGKTLAVVLSLALVVGVINGFAPKSASKTTLAKDKTVYDEIKLSKLSDEKLQNISSQALEDGAKAAKKVSSYKNEADYKAALDSALTSYYKKNDKKQLKKFTANLDKRADQTVANYEKAAKERAKGSKEFVTGKIIVLFDKGVTKKEIKDTCKAENAKIADSFKIFTGEYIATLDISLGQTVDMASKKFSKYTFVEAADRDDIYYPSSDVEPMESDSNSGSTLQVSDDVLNLTNDPYNKNLYHFDNLHIKGAWDYLRDHEHSRVKVAVIDSGCFYNNQDLKNVITDDSYDVVAARPMKEVQYNSAQSHGTCVMGTIAAESNNNKLISGVASGYDNSIVDIMAINVATSGGASPTNGMTNDNYIVAYNYAVMHGAQVINMSYGGSRNNNDAIKGLFKRMYDLGIVLIASGGNNGNNEPNYPSDYECVIAAGATNYCNVMTSFTSYGNKKSICAPGDDFYGLDRDKATLMHTSGTSFSAPCVTGIAAMMLSLNPNLTPYEIASIMQNTDDKSADLGTVNIFNNHGVVNAEKCVKEADGYVEKESYEADEDGLVNIADKATVTVSNPVDDYPASNINDNDSSTLGSVGVDTVRSINIDFDKQYDVNYLSFTLKNNVFGKYEVFYSEDGTNYNKIAYQNTATTIDKISSFPVGKNIFESKKVKSFRIEFSECEKEIFVKEITVASPGTVHREMNNSEKPNSLMRPLSLTTSIVGYHQVQVGFSVSDKAKAKDYSYEIYCEDEKIATTKDSKTIVNINESGKVNIGIKTIDEFGKESGMYITEVTLDWSQYETTEATTLEETTLPETQPQLENVALNKTATASSEENGETKAEYAIDGKDNTRWSSQWTDDEWLSVDLGDVYSISQVDIKWETARAASYTIETSLDGKTWITAATNNQNAENTTDTFAPINTRYVRMVGTKRNTGYGYSIFEMKVMGCASSVEPSTSEVITDPITEAPTTLAPTTTEQDRTSTTKEETTTYNTNVRRVITGYDIGTENIAVGKKVTSSSVENDGLKPEKACDGDMNTRWASSYNDDEWICVDLGEVTPVALLKLHWETAMGKDYNILFSLDGEEWFVKKYTTNNTNKNTTEAFLPEYTRYVKIEGKKRATGYGYSLFEMEIFPAIVKNEMVSTAYPTTEAPTTIAPTTPVALTNIALGANSSASSYESASMTSGKAFDGDMNTRWASEWTESAFLRVNLGAVKYISQIKINWEAAYAKDYDIQLSNEGKVWTTVKSVTNSDGGIDTINIGNTAMFIRLVCKKRATGYGYSIYEMSVLGK